MKNETKKLLMGKFTSENIKIKIVEQVLNFSMEVNNEIKKIWNKKEKESKEKGLNFYNGKSYRMINWSYEKNILNLELAIYDFKNRFGVNQIIDNNIFDIDEVRHGGCFVGGGVLTSDSKYAMIKLSGKSVNNNEYDLPGGILEDDIKFIPTGEFLFKTMKKEISEEMGVLEENIEDIYLEMMYQGNKDHIGFYFNIKLNISSNMLREKFKDNKDIDIESIDFHDKTEFIEILKNHNQSKQLIAQEIFRSN